MLVTTSARPAPISELSVALATLRNTGTEPLAIAFIFSKPGFEELMRANSVLEGEPATPLTAAEQAQTRARNRWHTVHE